MFLQLTN